jgi:putative flippase GtrA
LSGLADGPASPPRRFRFLDAGRLIRYVFAGGASAVTHLGTLALLVERGGVDPIVASSAGFTASIAVSYALQRRWVFASSVPNQTALPKFLAVTALGFALNAFIMWMGTAVFGLHYGPVQLIALAAIPMSNYTLNALWTFR